MKDISDIATGLLPPADFEDVRGAGREGEMWRGRGRRESTATTEGPKQALANSILSLHSIPGIRDTKIMQCHHTISDTKKLRRTTLVHLHSAFDHDRD